LEIKVLLSQSERKNCIQIIELLIFSRVIPKRSGRRIKTIPVGHSLKLETEVVFSKLGAIFRYSIMDIDKYIASGILELI